MKRLALSATVAAVALMGAIPAAQAETEKTTTVVQTRTLPETNQIKFSMFDVNNDGMYSREEVGEKLFYVFDKDGNEVIDNIEWDQETMYTIIPMEKETYRFVDYNDDGYTDLTEYTYEAFYQDSGLIRFDEDEDGLSAKEFINEGFLALDLDDSGTIELDEWEKAYIASLAPLNAEQDIYNQ
ncbi:MAG TPA: hypothetical protein EYQ41_03325 [Micavibrio sp.]|jgi:putative lipase involved disintegration of autophagic bodies|nr:hypothetical protein [Pseudomonadota bacterium]HIF25185.1 hypothetical protein [Micavibrio sp.]